MPNWSKRPAELRPIDQKAMTSSDTTQAPNYMFLTARDITTPAGTSDIYLMHGTGSHILFADGHVKQYDASFFPDRTTAWASGAYDIETNQWYNYVYYRPHNDKQKFLNRTIAITP